MANVMKFNVIWRDPKDDSRKSKVYGDRRNADKAVEWLAKNGKIAATIKPFFDKSDQTPRPVKPEEVEVIDKY